MALMGTHQCNLGAPQAFLGEGRGNMTSYQNLYAAVKKKKEHKEFVLVDAV